MPPAIHACTPQSTGAALSSGVTVAPQDAQELHARVTLNRAVVRNQQPTDKPTVCLMFTILQTDACFLHNQGSHMPFTKLSQSVARIVALAAFCAALNPAQAGASKALDTTGAIQNFDVLGIKLGMTEAQAVVAIKERFPAGTKDSRGRVINLKMTDYTWPNSITRAPMRAGIRFDLFPEQRTNYDFVKILVNDGKVWAIWRDDTTSTYAYEKTIGDMTAKYAGAVAINDYFDILVNGERKSDGTKTLAGFELYQGTCSDNTLPFGRVNQGDAMRLESTCSKFFRLHYGVISTAGVKTMGNGSAQLVDLDAGRAFLATMANAARNSAAKEATAGAKL
jgi:hypothetical protein